MQSSYSEPSGQEAPAAPSNFLKRDRDRDRERDRDRAALGMGSEPQLQRDSASQVELAAQAVEAREAEKERLRFAVLLRLALDPPQGLLGLLQASSQPQSWLERQKAGIACLRCVSESYSCSAPVSAGAFSIQA